MNPFSVVVIREVDEFAFKIPIVAKKRQGPGIRDGSLQSIVQRMDAIPNVPVICIAIRRHPKRRLRCFISTIARTSSDDGPLGPGFVLRADE